MAEREVKIRVTADDDTAAGLNSVSRRARKTADDVDKEATRAGKSLNDRITAGANRAAAKIKAFDKDVQDKIGYKTARGLGQAVEAFGKGLARVGVTGAAAVGKNLATSVQAAGPQVQTLITAMLVEGAITASPLVGAAIAGAFTGAIAVGGVAAGVLLAVRDQRVKSAGTELAQRLLGGLSTAASPFVQPLLGVINDINRRFLSAIPQISAGFAEAARYVRPLASAILDAGAAIGSGILAALRQAGPVVQGVSDGIRRMGQAVEYTIKLFASLGPQGGAAIRDLATVVSYLVEKVAGLIATIAQAYGFVRTLGGLVGDTGVQMRSASKSTAEAADGLYGFVEAADAAGGSAGTAASQTQALANAQMNLVDAFLGLEAAQIASSRALEAAKQVREDGAAFTVNERAAMLDLVNAYNSELEAMRAHGASSTEVNAKSNAFRETLIQQAVEMGLTRQKAEELVNQYGLFPKNVSTRVGVYGADTAEAELERVRAKAGSIPALINVAIRVTGSEASRQAIASALAKQSMSADLNAEFASTYGFAATGGRLAHAERRAAPVGPIQLTSDVLVQLDGKAIAPIATAVSREEAKRARWKSRARR